MLSRRTVMWSALGSGALATIPAFLWHHDENAIRIGLTKAGPLVIAKALGWLDQAMAGHGRAVSWHEFEAGPQLLEAMAAGALDFGMTGNTPPIFAQANGAALH